MTEQHNPSASASDQPAETTAPPSGWTPTPLSAGGRPSFGGERTSPPESAQALGGPAMPSVSIQEFAPPRSRLPLLVAVVAVVVAALIWAGTTLRAPQPTPAAGPTATPTASPTAAGLPFVTPDQQNTGRWEILNHRWTDSGLEVEIRIAADQGPVTYAFVAFGNDDVQATDSEPGLQSPQFSGMPIQTGNEETGWLFFRLERGPSTIILTTAEGNQMSALPVTA
jgi:hypothetical protein